MRWFCSLLFLFFFAAGFSNNKLFEKANLAYENGSYKEAINNYKILIDSGYVSSSLYFNLGNAYYKNNELGSSILYFEKALKLNPTNQDAIHNLALARALTVDKIDVLPELFFVVWWKQLLLLGNVRFWAKLFLLFVWLSCMIIGLKWFIANTTTRKWMNFGLALSLIASFFIGICTYSAYQMKRNQVAAIVMESRLSVKSAPDADATSLFNIHEGTKVRILDAAGDWNKILLNEDKIGWAPVSSIETI